MILQDEFSLDKTRCSDCLLSFIYLQTVFDVFFIHSLVSSSFSPRLVPTPQSSIPHPAIVPTAVKQEPGGSSSRPG